MDKMRIIVLVDMPTHTRHQRAVRKRFDRLLFESGFSTLQNGVFTRAGVSRGKVAALRDMLQQRRPDSGTVRFLALTEAQFQSSTLIAGRKDSQEEEIGAQLDIFL